MTYLEAPGRAVSAASPTSHRDAFALWVRTASLAIVIILPLIVMPWGQDPYNEPKALALYALSGLILCAWFLDRLVNGRRTQEMAAGAELVLLGFLFAVLISSAVSFDPRLTILGAPRRHDGLLTVAACVMLFFVGVRYFGTAGSVRRLTMWAGGSATVVTAYGLLQLLVPPLFAGEAFLRTWYGGLGVQRISSTIGSPIVFGGYLAFMLPLLAALAISGRTRLRFLWLGVACLSVLALTLTLTRAAWVAALACLVVFAVAAGWRAIWARRVECAVVLASIALSIVVFVTLIGSPADLGSRVATGASTESGSMAQRLYIWERSWHLVLQRPSFGWGLETLREIFPYDREPIHRLFGRRPVIIDKAHNDLLQMFVSVGVPGGALFMLFWMLTIGAAIRLVRRAGVENRWMAVGWLAAISAYFVQVQFSFSTVALAPIVWLIAGSAAGWEVQSRQKAEGWSLPIRGL